MADSDELLAKMRKEYGQSVATPGDTPMADVERIPTGIFPLDIALGGGWPMGKISIIFGPESSNKTNVMLKSIANGQKMYPDRKAVLVDAEHGYDDQWARRMGVDTSRLIVVRPECAEQAIDIMDAFAYATDIFAILLDSMAALSTRNELESSADKASVGGASLLIGKFLKKMVASQSRMMNQGIQSPAILCINQLRTKIGVMFGNPETMPGGWAPKYAATMIVRIYGKNVMEKKISASLPAFKECSCIVQKWKVPITATTAVFQMQMIDSPYTTAGVVEDWNTVLRYMQELGYFIKEKNGWNMFGTLYKTQAEAKEFLLADPETLFALKVQMIQEMMEVANGPTPSPDELEPEAETETYEDQVES